MKSLLITPLSFMDSILPKLKHSLSLTLQHYLSLSLVPSLGLTTPTNPSSTTQRVIRFPSCPLAESSANFSHLSRNNFVEAEEYHPIVPHLAKSHEQAPLLALQVTVFSNCGFCIGFTTHHAVFDGKSSTMFMKSWAHFCKHGGDSLEFAPSYNRTVIEDPAGLEGIFLNHEGPNNLGEAMPAALSPPLPVKLHSLQG